MNHKPTRWIMHIDMDAFFASVEQRDHPEYQGFPVVIGAEPGRRGVVATCSYEARCFGIRSAMPISEAYRRCPDAIYLRPDMQRYSTASRQVFEALANISPLVEPVSVDEAYVDITGLERLFGTPRQISELTKQKVWDAVNLRCSIGIGPNRLIAKLASEINKPDGIKIVCHDQIQAFLDPMPVRNLRGVGQKTQKIVEQLNIKSVRLLRSYPLSMLQQHFGNKGGKGLYDQARGITSDHVGHSKDRQSISKETTFNQDQHDPAVIDSTLLRLVAEVGRISRSKGLKGNTVTIKLRLSDFNSHTRQCKLSKPLNTDSSLLRTARQLYRTSGYAGQPLRLIGMGLSGWEADHATADLFADLEGEKREERLFETLDAVNEKFGEKLSLGLRRTD